MIDTLEPQLLRSRRILMIRAAARAGLRAQLLIQRRELELDQAGGLIGKVQDRLLIIEETEACLAMIDIPLNKFAALLSAQEAR